MLRSYLWQRLGSRDDAEDILQQAAVELATRLATVERDESRGLIITVVRRRLLDHLRSVYRRRSFDAAGGIEQQASPPGSERLEARELIGRMAVLLDNLPVADRELLSRFWEGSHELDRPLTVAERKQLERLRKLLKTRLEESRISGKG